MSFTASSTSVKKSVPSTLSGRSNALLLPERYSFTWAAASDRTEVSFSSMGSRF